MSAQILEFKKTEPEVPHGTGQAFCMGCNHRWEAVAPVGVIGFECPACHAMKGHFCFEHQVPGGMVRECSCGNQLFYLTPEGHFCPNCGTYQRY